MGREPAPSAPLPELRVTTSTRDLQADHAVAGHGGSRRQAGAAFSQGGFEAAEAIDGIAGGEDNGWAYYGLLAQAQVPAGARPGALPRPPVASPTAARPGPAATGVPGPPGCNQAAPRPSRRRGADRDVGR